METERKRVGIIGGGFGGLYAAKSLGKEPVDVVLVDRKNHHVFQPLLYQVATAALSPGDIADLTIPGHPEVFVIGDLAAAKDERGEMLPGLAAVALQEGKAAASNILTELRGERRRPFHYRDK